MRCDFIVSPQAAGSSPDVEKPGLAPDASKARRAGPCTTSAMMTWSEPPTLSRCGLLAKPKHSHICWSEMLSVLPQRRALFSVGDPRWTLLGACAMEPENPGVCRHGVLAGAAGIGRRVAAEAERGVRRFSFGTFGRRHSRVTDLLPREIICIVVSRRGDIDFLAGRFVGHPGVETSGPDRAAGVIGAGSDCQHSGRVGADENGEQRTSRAIDGQSLRAMRQPHDDGEACRGELKSFLMCLSRRGSSPFTGGSAATVTLVRRSEGRTSRGFTRRCVPQGDYGARTFADVAKRRH